MHLSHHQHGYRDIGTSFDLSRFYRTQDIQEAKIDETVSRILKKPIQVLTKLNQLRLLRVETWKIKKAERKMLREFGSYSQEKKMDIYADRRKLLRILSMVSAFIDDQLKNGNPGHIDKLLFKQTLQFDRYLNKIDDRLYKLTYADLPDLDDPEYIRELNETYK